MSKFDDDGDIILEFEEPEVDDFPDPPKTKPSRPKKSEGLTLLQKLKNSELTKKDLIDAELLDVLRQAWKSKKIAKILKYHLNLRPVYVKEEFTLKPHQLQVLEFMKKCESTENHGILGGVLSASMGLGKSLCASILALSAPREPLRSVKKGKKGFPTLIVASKTVMGEWKRECFEKFFVGVRVLYFHTMYIGAEAMKNMTRKEIIQYDIVLTTYDLCNGACKSGKWYEECLVKVTQFGKEKVSEIKCRTLTQADKPNVTGIGVVYCTPWERVVLDESQRTAITTTLTYKAVMALYGRYKWCLSGTPIRNYDTDIWAQLRFCGYNRVTKAKDWMAQGLWRLRNENLRNNIIVMNYEDAGVYIPEKIHNVVRAKFNVVEQAVYDAVLSAAKFAYDDLLKGLCSFACILAMFTRLRQVCIAPYLITAESKRKKGLSCPDDEDSKEAIRRLKEALKGYLGEWVYRRDEAGVGSTKIQEIVKILLRIPKGEKILVFSMFTSALDLLVDAVQEADKDYTLLQVDGDVTGKEREYRLSRFRDDPEVRALFMSYRVGSEGLNITEATHVLCIEPWWTDAVHNQAIARCHRSGQVHKVNVHNVYIENSIENRILALCQKKNNMAEGYLSGSKRKITKMDKYTLGKLLGVY